MHSKKGHSAGVWLKMAKDGSRAGQEHRLLEELLHHPTPLHHARAGSHHLQVTTAHSEGLHTCAAHSPYLDLFKSFP